MLVSGATFHPVLNAHSQSSHNGPHETLEAELMSLSPHHRRIIYLRPNYEPPPASVSSHQPPPAYASAARPGARRPSPRG